MTTVNVWDETEKDDSVAPVQYNISSFGADYDVEGLVRRLERGDIFIPHFQRDYVWKIAEASRFIESLLLGLPVPGVFLARDTISTRLLVIDGQQRLKSLEFFFKGVFNPSVESKSHRVFQLTRVQKRFEGLTYETLSEDDRRILHDTIIHATIIKQESPRDDDTSIYHIFERLNASGKKLTPQEIRVAIYHSQFIEMIHKLNDDKSWREIFGGYSTTLKDEELILRFLAMYYSGEHYRKPMNEFLNKFAQWARNQDESFLLHCADIFTKTIHLIHDVIGVKAFRPERALNAAVFDSVMVAVAKQVDNGTNIDRAKLQMSYEKLLIDETYLQLTSQSTSDDKNVENRLSKAISQFSDIV